MDTDPVQIWLNGVKIGRSGSKSTQDLYRRVIAEFLTFLGKSAKEIEEEFNNSDTLKAERNFKKKYTDAVNGYIEHLQTLGKCPNSISTEIGVIKSFFKYRELPLNFDILRVSTTIQYPDRDITKEELLLVLEAAKSQVNGILIAKFLTYSKT